MHYQVEALACIEVAALTNCKPAQILVPALFYSIQSRLNTSTTAFFIVMIVMHVRDVT